MRLSLHSKFSFRGLIACGLLAFGVVHAAAPVGAVVEIASGPVADLVVIGQGLEAGFRTGMICRVERASVEIGELLLVEVRPTCASALISSLPAGQSFRVGDLVTVKISKS